MKTITFPLSTTSIKVEGHYDRYKTNITLETEMFDVVNIIQSITEEYGFGVIFQSMCDNEFNGFYSEVLEEYETREK